MSYDLSLCNPVTKEILLLDTPHEMRGGTYAVGGTVDCSLNITYNYSRHYYRVFDGDGGIHIIDRMTGADSIPVLQRAIDQLGDEIDDDYWQPSEGNAKAPLFQLIALAKMRPDGVWSIC